MVTMLTNRKIEYSIEINEDDELQCPSCLEYYDVDEWGTQNVLYEKILCRTEYYYCTNCNTRFKVKKTPSRRVLKKKKNKIKTIQKKLKIK